MNKQAIVVENLWKGYELGTGKSGNLRDTLSGIFQKSSGDKELFWALKEVSFSIDQGETVGVIGRNGAGKSTLLKILSRITYPTKGRFELNGRVSSLLEVGTGFHPELTGKENIYLNGTILGMTRAEVKKKLDEIIAFSGVEKFIDTPVKRYSSGMTVRLAFSVAAHLDPEILIVDEVLAVGDAEFQQKCLGKMKDVSRNLGRTVIFVSHNMTAVSALCNKGIMMKYGQIFYSGGIAGCIDAYFSDMDASSHLTNGQFHSIENEFLDIVSVQMEPLNGKIINLSSGVQFKIELLNKLPGENLTFSLNLKNQEGLLIGEIPTIISSSKDSKIGTYTISGIIQPDTLNSGIYYLDALYARNQQEVLYSGENIIRFEINNESIGANYQKLPGVLSFRNCTRVSFR